MKPISIKLDRSARTSLSDQIHDSIRLGIENGALAPGARLPSWLDLAAQLGVARGTVRQAYEKLTAGQFVTASRASGTCVAARPSTAARKVQKPAQGSFMETYYDLTAGPFVFQMGVPSQAAFPATMFARMRAQAVRAELAASLYPDPCGELELRREIAAYLAIARGIDCAPSQILITSGFSGGLGLALRALNLSGRKAWVEDPGFPFTQHGLKLAGLSLVPVPVDDDGVDVDHAIRTAPDAALAVLTPGQQATLGSTLSLERRLCLLEWASEHDAWIIEDDYLSELQLSGRAAPALASLDRKGRVIHIGTFSKTLSPALRLGFLVAPPALVSRFAEVAACLAPAPSPSVQIATAQFMREGHYMRHLRRCKRLYGLQRDALLHRLGQRGYDVSVVGLSVLLALPKGTPDADIASACLKVGLAPSALSARYMSQKTARSGLLLGIATAPEKQLDKACGKLFSVLEKAKRSS